MNRLKLFSIPLALWLVAYAARPTPAAIVSFQIQVDNIGPLGGVALTPLWVGFHSGNFDIYDEGVAAASFLERLAEDGDVGPISAAFGSAAGRVQGVLATSAPGPILPGQSATGTFMLQDDGSNRYFSYGAMVIPSNDFFVANADPLAIDLSTLLNNQSGAISFLVGAPGTVKDAGTEASDFGTSAGNPLFAALPNPSGQTGPNQGPADPNSNIRNVLGDPFADFGIGVPAEFNFNDASRYSAGGIARVTITAVPEPSSVIWLLAGIVSTVVRRRRPQRRVC